MENMRLLLLPLCVLILIPWKVPETELTFMDVGQGDGIYLNCGEEILIDSGSSSSRRIGEYTTEPFLESRAAGKLDRVFVTHADADHKNGIEYLLENRKIDADILYLPCSARTDEKYDSIRSAAAGSIQYLKAGDTLDAGRGRIYCLSPEDGPEQTDTNEQSLVLLYEEGDFRALLMGDAGKNIEEEIMRKYQLPDVTVLKCGHHGSSSSTCSRLLDETKPLTAVLSYGDGNRYGHPHAETVENLKKRGIPALRTAERGAITFHTDGKKVRLDQFADNGRW